MSQGSDNSPIPFPGRPAPEVERPKNECPIFARATVKLPLVFDYCQANPKCDPYVEMTGRLLLNFPQDEEQIIHNFIDALSCSNLKMKDIIANQNITMAAMEGKGIVIPTNEVVHRGRGPLPPKKGGRH
jgi:hypothetical protein